METRQGHVCTCAEELVQESEATQQDHRQQQTLTGLMSREDCRMLSLWAYDPAAEAPSCKELL